MALDINEIKFLLRARRLGVSFAETAAIGRQALHVNRENLTKLLTDYGLDASATTVENILMGSDGYAEKLFELLGAHETASFDASDYEHAPFKISASNAPSLYSFDTISTKRRRR